MASNPDVTEDIHSLLLSIQRDPTKAGAALPSLSKPELLQLFGLFISDDSGAQAQTNTDEEKSKDGSALRASAYVALSSYITSVRTSSSGTQDDPAVATNTLVKAFAPVVDDTLRGTNIPHLTSALAFLSALFQVDPATAVALLVRGGNIECISDVVDLVGASADRTMGVDGLRREFVTLLSNAAGHTTCRKALVQSDLTGGEGKFKRWLEAIVDRDEGKDKRVKAAAALALVKFYQGSLQDAESESHTQKEETRIEEAEAEMNLMRLMEKMILAEVPTKTSSTSSSNSTVKSSIILNKSLLDAIEGLAYLSVHSTVKAQIVSSPALISALIQVSHASTNLPQSGGKTHASLGSTAANRENSSKLAKTADHPARNRNQPSDLPERNEQPGDPRVNVGLHYGLALVFMNLVQYRPRLGKEEEQIAKLRELSKPSGSKAAGTSTKDEDSNMTDDAVKGRVVALCKAGLLPVLPGLARSESGSARTCIARIYAAIVEDGRGSKKPTKETNLRGSVLANGGGRALFGIIKAGSGFGKGKEKLQETPDWIAIQALSKLAITASPLQVFGPDLGTTYDAIPVFASVLTYSDSISSSTGPLKRSGGEEPNDLQKFEAIMALTNLASLGEEVATRIVGTKGLWEALESGLLDEGHGGLMRRASAELVCNLVVCEKGFGMFMPTKLDEGPKSRQESRLHLLIALSDVEDLATRRAASGALAMLTSEEGVCIGLSRLQRERGTALGIIGRLLVDEPEDEEESQTADSKQTIADSQLVHRGIVILRNLAVLLIKPSKPEAKELIQDMEKEGTVGLVEAVVKDCIQRGEKSGPVLENAVEFVVALRGSKSVRDSNS